ncbi:hypothetical protein WJX79_000326 [Trebouxia sp. C0005]
MVAMYDMPLQSFPGEACHLTSSVKEGAPIMLLRNMHGARDTAEKLRVAVTTMDATLLRRGVTISTKKTRVLVVSTNAAAQAADSVITLQGDQLEVVSFFKYLGSVFVSDCTLDAEITHQAKDLGG